MGTDLRLSAERRGNVDGSWTLVLPADGSTLYDGCAHPLFSVLANECNGDPRDGEPYRPISQPRGVPEDASAEFRKRVDAWGSDAFSHSWLSLGEIVDYDWQQIVLRRGVVFARDFATWDGANGPRSWCRWVLSPAECDIDNDAMRALVARAEAEQYPLTEQRTECPPGISAELHDLVQTRYTTIEWRETYATSCKHFFETTMPKLLALGPVDEMRIVFFFDR